jgi:4-amino-4-deoxy-L-arabinose transferase-like glycosyltransferase
MTTLELPPLRPLEEVKPETPPPLRQTMRGAGSALRRWVRNHRTSLVYLAGPLIATAVLMGWNVYQYPFKSVNDDEGTYVAQAWAVEKWGELAHYTYWYDHPPLGWIQIAGWTWLTDAFDRVDAVSAGRELMVIYKVISVALLFVLMRRLMFRPITAAVAAALFGLSPLAIQFSRMVFLDNITMPWALAAFVLALSPTKRLSAAVGSGLCFAVAVLSKETIVIWLPFLLWVLWRNSDVRTRSFCIGLYASVFVCVGAIYPLYALLKNELFPGPDHVDLWSALIWQAFGRESLGNVFTEGTTHTWVMSWFSLDSWLLIGAMLVTLPILVKSYRLRPFAALTLVQIFLIVRGGYVPYAFVIAVIPLAAMLCAGAGEEIVRFVLRRRKEVKRVAGPVLAASLAAVFAVMVPTWVARIAPQLTAQANSASNQALEWMNQNATKDAWIITDDSNWVDLVEMGFSSDRVIWFYKVDSDPEVAALHKDLGWRRFDYLIQSDFVLTAIGDDGGEPTVTQALENSEEVISFTSPGPEGYTHHVQILKVKK